MSDQAQGLRALADQMRGEQAVPVPQQHHAVRSTPTPEDPLAVSPLCTPPSELLVSHAAVADTRRHALRARTTRRPQARIVAITSGKGGVGKSNLSTNLSVTLGQRGKRVIVLDADLGLANAHILLGTSPRYGLEHVMRGTKTVSEVLHTASANVQLISGGSGITELANLSDDTRNAFLLGLRELDSTCDLIVIDTGAGVAQNVLAFLCAVNEVIIVTTPEPTAIANAYATTKIVAQENPGVRLMLAVNMVHSSGEGTAVAQRLNSITRQFLNLELEYLGCIPVDPAVPKAVRQRTPFVSAAPGCAAAAGVNQIIRRLGYCPGDEFPQNGMDGLVNRMQRFFGICVSP